MIIGHEDIDPRAIDHPLLVRSRAVASAPKRQPARASVGREAPSAELTTAAGTAWLVSLALPTASTAVDKGVHGALATRSPAFSMRTPGALA